LENATHFEINCSDPPCNQPYEEEKTFQFHFPGIYYYEITMQTPEREIFSHYPAIEVFKVLNYDEQLEMDANQAILAKETEQTIDESELSNGEDLLENVYFYGAIASIIGASLGALAIILHFKRQIKELIKGKKGSEKQFDIKKHNANLQKLIEKLTSIRCHQEKNHTVTLKVSQNPDLRPKPIRSLKDMPDYLREGREPNFLIGWENVSKLDYFDNLICHFKDGYKETAKKWKNLERKVSEYNTKVEEIRNLTTEKIKVEIKKELPHYVEYEHEDKSKPYYHTRHMIDSLLFENLRNYAESEAKSDLSVFAESSNLKWAIRTKGYPIAPNHLLAFTDKKDDEIAIKQLLSKIRDEFEIDKFKDLNKRWEDLLEIIQEFRKSMFEIVKALNDGESVKGSCSRCLLR